MSPAMAAAAALRGHLVDVREFEREEVTAMEPVLSSVRNRRTAR